ncbi:hypothetical protein ACFOUO_14895 [Salinithrix halophila]|uniref:Uncharacterized protein n=1 Tax=Salinithrix halophila TaxID=1485204 RepID=A0ABV8JHA1_9BACL
MGILTRKKTVVLEGSGFFVAIPMDINIDWFVKQTKSMEDKARGKVGNLSPVRLLCYNPINFYPG